MRLLRETVTGPDVLMVMMEELRRTRPPVWDGDRWMLWELAVGQTIAALPTSSQRWAVATLIANDLVCAIPCLSLAVAYGHIRELVVQAGGVMEDTTS